MSGSTAPVYLCAGLYAANIGRRSSVLSRCPIGGTAIAADSVLTNGRTGGSCAAYRTSGQSPYSNVKRGIPGKFVLKYSSVGVKKSISYVRPAVPAGVVTLIWLAEITEKFGCNVGLLDPA